MPITVKRVQVWRTEVEHTPGQLAKALGPLAAAGADLQVVMAYHQPGDTVRAFVEVFPVTGRAQSNAARSSGLAASPIPVLLVEGDNKPGLGAAFADALGSNGINVSFLVAQVVNKKFKAVYGFENDADAKKAAGLLKKAGAPAKGRAAKKR
jgi:hypothetical protein